MTSEVQPAITLYNYESPNRLKYKNKNEHVPQWHFRCLVVGQSGCGKTNLVLNLVYRLLYYHKIYVFVKDITEDKYQDLQEFFRDVESKLEEKGYDESVLEIGTEVIPVDELDKVKQNLCIFDDFVADTNQKLVEEYFLRGRKKNCSVIYISQDYFKTPRFIRLQCNCFVLYPVNSKYQIRSIIQDKALGVDAKEFERMFVKATKERYSFLFIDLVGDKTFRIGFDIVLTL